MRKRAWLVVVQAGEGLVGSPCAGGGGVTSVGLEFGVSKGKEGTQGEGRDSEGEGAQGG